MFPTQTFPGTNIYYRKHFCKEMFCARKCFVPGNGLCGNVH